MNLKDFSLMREDENSYTVGHPEGKSMTIPKAGLSDKAHHLIKKLKSVQKFDDGGQVQSDSVQDSPEQIVSDAGQTPNSKIPAAPPTAMDAATPPDTSNRALASEEPAVTANAGTEGAINAQEKAAQMEAAATAGQGSAEAKAIQSNLDDLSKLPKLADLQAAQKIKDDAFAQKLQNEKIDPDRYWHHQGAGNKLAAGIGLLLSGMGSATTGQPNLAEKNIRSHIDNDIEAQKNEQSKTMNLWKMNREAYGNDLAANLATKNQLNTVLQHKIALAASQFKGPQAQAIAQAKIGQLEQEKAQNRFKLSLMNPAGDAPDPSTRVQFLVPPEKQAKVFDEIDAAKATSANGPKILEAFDNAANNIHAMDFVPGVPNADQKALHALMGPTFKDVEGTVRQAAMDNMNQNTTPQFGDDANTIKTKRNALIGYLTSKANSASTAKGFGIDLKKFPTTNFTPVDPSSAPVERQTKDGRVALFNPKTKQFLGYK